MLKHRPKFNSRTGSSAEICVNLDTGKSSTRLVIVALVHNHERICGSRLYGYLPLQNVVPSSCISNGKHTVLKHKTSAFNYAIIGKSQSSTSLLRNQTRAHLIRRSYHQRTTGEGSAIIRINSECQAFPFADIDIR